jgi:hypothetical protein
MAIDKNFMIVLVGLTITIFAILTISPVSGSPVVESFWNAPQFQTKILPPLVKRTERLREFNVPFVSVSGRQSNIAPRFDNGQTGKAVVRLPAAKHLAAPSNPLNPLNFESDMPAAPENYSGYNQGYTENFEDPSAPVGDMTQPDLLAQPIIYDRLIFANKNSRTRSKGDLIRGDLAIAPNQTGWFQVAANPTLDLQQGALNVMAGANEQGSRMAQFMKQASNGALATVGGVNTNEFGTTISAGGAVNVSSRP